MVEGLCITARQTLVLFLLMCFGIFSRKARILDEPSVKRLTEFVLVIVTPCLIVSSSSISSAGRTEYGRYRAGSVRADSARRLSTRG